MKIITQKIKKKNLELRVAKLVQCNALRKSKHCIIACRHCFPHEKDIGNGGCHQSTEFCTLSLGGIIKVICKKLTKKQQNEWIKKELKK